MMMMVVVKVSSSSGVGDGWEFVAGFGEVLLERRIRESKKRTKLATHTL